MLVGTFLSHARKLLFSLVVVALPLAAQTGLGIVRGTVQDVSKAVIPGAKVSLTSSSTGVVRNAESSSVGIYYFGAVPIGSYTLAVEAQGFKKWSGTLEVLAGQTVAIDPTMEVGSLESTVEVTGAAPVISTEGGQVSDVKDALRIHQLPLDGRSVTTLFDLTPGVGLLERGRYPDRLVRVVLKKDLYGALSILEGLRERTLLDYGRHPSVDRVAEDLEDFTGENPVVPVKNSRPRFDDDSAHGKEC